MPPIKHVNNTMPEPPEDRLVATELEQRWNWALERVQGLEGQGIERRPLWQDPGTDVGLGKRIVNLRSFVA